MANIKPSNIIWQSVRRIDIIKKGKTKKTLIRNIRSNTIEKEPTVNALLVEYQNIHQRVFNQIKTYESNNIQILILIGLLLYFGIEKYFCKDLFIPINILFTIALPFISLCSVSITAAHLYKIMVFGDFLRINENKVNKVLENEATYYGFCRKQVLGWEYWRIKYGYANKTKAFCDISLSTFMVIIFFLVSLIAGIFRLNHLVGMGSSMEIFKALFITIKICTLAIFIASCIILGRKKLKMNEDIESDSVEYI